MSKKLLVVFGATGNQGGSVADYVLGDTELSNKYSIRAITRSASNPRAQTLRKKGAEIVEADLDNPSSLESAIGGAHTVFALTNTQASNTKATETKQAKALCNALIHAGVKYVIWSSLPHAAKISNGKLNVEHFDVKAEIEEYMRGLPIKSSFFAPGYFMQNFLSQLMPPRPSPTNDGTYVLANPCHGNTLMPLIDVTDTGKWVGAILAEPSKYEGKVFAAAEGLYTWDDIAQIMSKIAEKTVKYQNVPDEVFRGWLPEGLRDDLLEMYLLFREYGYYGKTMKDDVEWAAKQARGHLTSLEEFLRRENFKLDQ